MIPQELSDPDTHGLLVLYYTLQMQSEYAFLHSKLSEKYPNLPPALTEKVDPINSLLMLFELRTSFLEEATLFKSFLPHSQNEYARCTHLYALVDEAYQRQCTFFSTLGPIIHAVAKDYNTSPENVSTTQNLHDIITKRVWKKREYAKAYFDTIQEVEILLNSIEFQNDEETELPLDLISDLTTATQDYWNSELDRMYGPHGHCLN